MKRTLLIAIMFLGFSNLNAQNCSDCAPIGWAYTTSIEVVNSNADTLIDYAIDITLNTQTWISQNQMLPTGDDIRFTTDCDSIIEHWIESGINTATTRIWVKIPEILGNSTDTIFMHFGNPNATNTENPEQVFTFFDHFDSLNTAVWNVTSINTATNNSILTTSNSSGDGGISTNQFFYCSGNINAEATWYGKLNTKIPDRFTTVGFGFNINPWNTRTGIYPFFTSSVDRFGTQQVLSGGDCTGNIQPTDTFYHRLTTILNTRFELDGSPSVMCGNYVDSMRAAASSWSSGTDMDYDWVFVRQHIDPEPGLTELYTDTIFNITLSGIDLECFGDSDGVATATPVSGASPYVYQWDAAAYSQTDSSATGLNGGTYSITVTDDIGCTKVDSITINEPTQLVVSLSSNGDTGGCNGDATASVSGGTPPYSYLWDDSNTQTTATATGLCGGIYNVTVTDSLGCVFTDTISVSYPVGIEGVKSNSLFKVFPNPSTGLFVIQPSYQRDVIVETYNSIGRKVLVTKMNAGERTELNLSEYSSGMYQLLIFEKGKLLHSEKLIKH